MLTEFGKTLRKLRIDYSERMIDMAQRINRSQGFLSSIEHGNKPVPEGFDDVLIKAYNLTGIPADDIKIAYLRSKIVTLVEYHRYCFDWYIADQLIEFVEIYPLEKLKKIHKCVADVVAVLGDI